MKRKEREEEILRQMLEDSPSAENTSSQSSSAPAKKSSKADTTTRCPKCGYVLSNRSGCPRCGYNGYIPMSDSELKKTKLILYPILLVIAIIIYLITKGYITL